MQDIDPDIEEAIKAIPQGKWDEFFEQIKAKEYHQVEHSEEPLTDLRARVKMVSEINGMFRLIHSQQNTKAS